MQLIIHLKPLEFVASYPHPHFYESMQTTLFVSLEEELLINNWTHIKIYNVFKKIMELMSKNMTFFRLIYHL